MRKILFGFIFISSSVYASDPTVSVYDQTLQDTSAFKEALHGGDIKEGVWKFFQFSNTDSVFGSLSVSKSGDSQSIKFNAINYNLWFGGNKKLPFQIYASDAVSDGSDPQEEKNTANLLDPESGFAIKFPLLWTYQSSGDGFCAFLSDKNSIGHCSVGGDITFNFKELTDENGNDETAFGQTVRVGVAALFPVLSAEDGSEQGYLAASAKVVYSHTNIDDTTQLFTPVLDAGGDPVNFDESILSGEFEIKWAFTGELAITARWLKPFDNKEYIDNLFKLGLVTQF